MLTATQATDPLLNEREATHGDYGVNAGISQSLKDFIRATHNYKNLSDDKKESLDLIATKIARILSGDADEPEHWKDIGGYARLAERGCSQPK